MARTQKITLCWYGKTEKNWKYFRALWENDRGLMTPRPGWVLENGVEVEYPVGRFVLRSYKDGKKVYTPVNNNPNNNAAIARAALQRAGREALLLGSPRDPRKQLKTAPAAYIKDCKAQGHMEAAEQARLVLNECIPLARGVQWVKDINRQHVLAFHQKLRDRGCSPRTIANKDARVRSFLRFCGVDTSFLPPKPRYEEAEAQIYSPGQLRSILDACCHSTGTCSWMPLHGVSAVVRLTSATSGSMTTRRRSSSMWKATRSPMRGRESSS